MSAKSNESALLLSRKKTRAPKQRRRGNRLKTIDSVDCNSHVSKEITIIWNAVLPCDFNCSICCVNALFIKPCEYPLYEKILVKTGWQLALEDQLSLVDQLEELKGPKHVDISGGNPAFLMLQGGKVIKQLGEKIGRENVSISLPGSLVTPKTAEFIASYVSEVEVTVDTWPGGFEFDPTRFPQMAAVAIAGLKMFKKLDVRKVCCTVLKSGVNIDKQFLLRLGNYLKSSNTVDVWEWLRYFPVGRGSHLISYVIRPVDFPRIFLAHGSLRDKYAGEFEVILHHSLENMLNQVKNQKSGGCRAMQNQTVGILPDGTAILCPWLLDAMGRPLSPKFELGKLPSENLHDILRNKRIRKWDLRSQSDCQSCQIANTCDECLTASLSISKLLIPSMTTRNGCTAMCFPQIWARHQKFGHLACFGNQCINIKECLLGSGIENGKVVVAVSALVTNTRQQILLVNRNNQPWKGMWAIPGGKVEFGESFENALKREVKEETGLDINLHRKLGVQTTMTNEVAGNRCQFVLIDYQASAVDEELRPLTFDVSEARWVDVSDLMRYKLTPPTSVTIRDYLASKRRVKQTEPLYLLREVKP